MQQTFDNQSEQNATISMKAGFLETSEEYVSMRRMSSLHGILTWDSCTWLVVSEFQPKCISIFQPWLQIPGSILIKEFMGLDRCSYLVIFVLFLFYSNSWKGNIMQGILTNPSLPTCSKFWRGSTQPRNGRTVVLRCCEGDDLARIVNKVLGKSIVQHFVQSQFKLTKLHVIV